MQYHPGPIHVVYQFQPVYQTCTRRQISGRGSSDMPQPNLKLQAARKQRHWSQEDAAAAIGIDRKTFNRWERGLSFPQPKLLDAACKVFGMSAAALGFDSLLEASVAEIQQSLAVAGSKGQPHSPAINGLFTPAHASKLMLLQDIIDRNFTGDFTEDFNR